MLLLVTSQRYWGAKPLSHRCYRYCIQLWELTLNTSSLRRGRSVNSIIPLTGMRHVSSFSQELTLPTHPSPLNTTLCAVLALSASQTSMCTEHLGILLGCRSWISRAGWCRDQVNPRLWGVRPRQCGKAPQVTPMGNWGRTHARRFGRATSSIWLLGPLSVAPAPATPTH